MDQVKCIDCGRVVSNWPIWLANTSVGVRCSRCSGSGATMINPPKERTTLVPLTNTAPPAAEPVEAA